MNRTEQVVIHQAKNTSADKKAVEHLMRETFEYHARVAQGEGSLTFRPQAQESYLQECLNVLGFADNESGYEPARAFLAWFADRPVGFLLARIMRDHYYQNEFYGYIEQLIVGDGWRNRGVGSKLLDEAYKWLRSRYIYTATLKVYGPNQEALKFYRRQGFSPLRYELIKHI